MLRKLYIKARLFLYAERSFLNKVAVIIMITTFSYLLLDSFLFKTIILDKANHEQLNHNYSNAIVFYNIAYVYYSANHLSDENKDIYLELPYKISLCYLSENDKKKSVQSMLNGITSIQKQYGNFSKENAYFIKNYLIDFYIINNDFGLANSEFNNLVTIYKKIGYDESIVTDLIRINGDLYYQQGNYNEAINLYYQAYDKIVAQNNIDYEVFAKIVNRIGDYEAKNSNVDNAIDIYKKALLTLKNAPNKYSYLTADILINLGSLYSANDMSTKDAINYYEQAIDIIKTLPKTNHLKQNVETYLTTLKTLYIKSNQYTKANETDLEITRQRRFSFF